MGINQSSESIEKEFSHEICPMQDIFRNKIIMVISKETAIKMGKCIDDESARRIFSINLMEIPIVRTETQFEYIPIDLVRNALQIALGE